MASREFKITILSAEKDGVQPSTPLDLNKKEVGWGNATRVCGVG